MKPRAADAPVAADETLDAELDSHLDTDIGTAVPAPRTPAPASAVPAQPGAREPAVDAIPQAAEAVGDAARRRPERVVPVGPQAADQPALTDREREILAFEGKWWRHAGAKEQAIRDSFGLSATRYYQILNGLLDNPAALAADPMLVGRLRRLRSTRARTRRR